MGGAIKSIENRKNRKDTPKENIYVWDLPTRLFHWTLVALVSSAWITSEYFEELGDPRLQWHRWNGFAVFTLLIWRGLWGVWGPPSARFKNFLKGPVTVYQYSKDLLIGNPRQFQGHNPLGALMIVALLVVLTSITFLGLFSSEENDLASGPLAYFVSEKLVKLATKWHGLFFDALLVGLVSIHIAANSLYGIIKKENLVKAMFSGKKPYAEYEDRDFSFQEIDFTKRAIIFFGLSLAIVFFVVCVIGK